MSNRCLSSSQFLFVFSSWIINEFSQKLLNQNNIVNIAESRQQNREYWIAKHASIGHGNNVPYGKNDDHPGKLSPTPFERCTIDICITSWWSQLLFNYNYNYNYNYYIYIHSSFVLDCDPASGKTAKALKNLFQEYFVHKNLQPPQNATKQDACWGVHSACMPRRKWAQGRNQLTLFWRLNWKLTRLQGP